MLDPVSGSQPLVVGRYSLHSEIASGGMATVHLGRLAGPVGFSRTVAIKRLHAQFAKDPEFVAMFLDEARLAARIQHPNVVSIIDVVAERGELLLVMDYIQGESLAKLMRAENKRGTQMAPNLACKIMSEVLAGLHGAHEVKNERGVPLEVVHRDVSPQNILVGVDGVAHLIDFGVAKASERAHCTREGMVKGKLAYMAPEQIRAGVVDRRTDLYSVGVVLWEALTGQRLFQGGDASLMYAVLSEPVRPPSVVVPGLSTTALDGVVMKAIDRDPNKRYATALEMADALEQAIRPSTSREVGRWLEQLVASSLERRARMVSMVESLPAGESAAGGETDGSDLKSSPLWRAASGASSVRELLEAQEAGEKSKDINTQTNSTISSGRIQIARFQARSRFLIPGIVLAAAALLCIIALILHGKSGAASVQQVASSVSSAVAEPLASVAVADPSAALTVATANASAAPSKADSPSSVAPPTPTVQKKAGAKAAAAVPAVAKKPAYTRE
jgi:serine/threonine-protein kinase